MTKNTVDWTKPVEYEWDTGIWVSINPVYRDNDGVLFEVSDPQDGEKCRLYWPHKEINAYMFFRNVKESRAVHKDNRLDLTKPLEGYWTKSGEYAGPIKYVGQMDDASANFPAWFIVRWGEDYEDSEHFLMRGDGKTDIPGLTVRNKTEGFEHKEVASKLKLPLEVGKKYRTGGGIIVTVQDINDPFENYGPVRTDHVYYHRDGTFAEGRNPSANIIEGPL